MAKKRLAAIVKIQIPAGQATPAPPVGTALGPHGINIMDFCKAYNAITESQRGLIIPAEISIYEDRSFTFVTKTPPTPFLLRQAAGIEKGAANPRTEKVGKGHAGPGATDRGDEDARPERHRSRGRDAAGCRHRPIDGNRDRRLLSPSPPADDLAAGARVTEGACQGGETMSSTARSSPRPHGATTASGSIRPPRRSTS